MTTTDFRPGVCVLAHQYRPERDRRAAEGSYLCVGCQVALEQNLAELPAQHEALVEELATGGNGAWTAKVTGNPEQALIANPAVIRVRDDIARVLASWAVLHAEERAIAAPRSPEPSATAVWLLKHLSWAYGQLWVDDYATELKDLRRSARSLLAPSGRRRVEVGPCIEPECLGTLTAVLVPADDLLPSAITCNADSTHEWEASRWLLLGRRIHGAAGISEKSARVLAKAITI